MENKDCIKFIHIRDGIKTVVTLDPDMNINGLLDEFKYFCLGISYSPKNVECIQYIEEDEC